MSIETLMKQIEELPETEREELLDRLYDRYGDDEAPIQISDEMKQLLDDRVAAYEADPTNVRTWEQVMESLRRKNEPAL